MYTQIAMFAPGTLNLYLHPPGRGYLVDSFNHLFSLAAYGDELNPILIQPSKIFIAGKPAVKHNIAQLFLFVVAAMMVKVQKFKPTSLSSLCITLALP